MLTLIEQNVTKEILQTLLQDLAPLSREAYREAIKDFMIFTIQRKQTNPYQNPHGALVAYRAHLKSQLAPATANKKLSAVRKFFKFALAAQLLTFEQFAGVELVTNIPDDGDHFKTWLEKDEAQLLLNAPDSSLQGKRDRVVILFLLGLGMRRAEAVSVTWEQIIRKDNMWLIADVRGKRNKVRTLRIPDRFYSVLEDYGRLTGKVLRSISRHGALGESLSERAVNQIIDRYSKELNLDMTPHTLRRTAATLSYENGASLKQVQRMLGHASVETTQNSYIQPKQDLQHFATERMPFNL